VYPIEDLVERSTFIEAAYLIIFGELPTRAQLRKFSQLLTEHQFIHEAHLQPHARIYRPRQIYTGPTVRSYVPIEQRG